MVFDISKLEAIMPVVDRAKAAGAHAVHFLASSLFFPMAPAALEHINRARLPSIFHWPEMAERGHLRVNPRELASVDAGSFAQSLCNLI